MAYRNITDVLDLYEVGPDVFRAGVTEQERERLFGGQVAAQALVAAERTVHESRRVHSLHAYFLRPGKGDAPVDFAVDRERDGRSFTTRHVVGRQAGETIFSLTASFQVIEEGLSHQETVLNAPPPMECKELDEWFAERDERSLNAFVLGYRDSPIEMRFATPPPPMVADAGPLPSHHGVWMRFREKLPDAQLMHVCSVTYASDLFLMGTAMRPHGIGLLSPSVIGASLDHAMWFHSDFRADEWFYYHLESPWSGGSRGLNFGRMYTEDGRHVVSVAQEGMIRLRKPTPDA